MKELREFWNEMDSRERLEAIGGLFAWGGLFFMAFMMSVMFG